MNFKKTCKCVVSFVLGTGMMFSSLAFNNKSNAVFSENFYTENREKYKDDQGMTLLLSLLKKLQDNKEELRKTALENLITIDGQEVVKTLGEFEEAVGEVTAALERKIEAQKTAFKARLSFIDMAIKYIKKRITIEKLEMVKEPRATANKSLDTATNEYNQKVGTTSSFLRILLMRLMALAVSETMVKDDNDHLCLESLVPSMNALFEQNSPELESLMCAGQTLFVKADFDSIMQSVFGDRQD